jgi:hypothetical protein
VEARYSTIVVLDFRTIPSESLKGIPFEGCPLDWVCRRSASHLSESALRSAIIAYRKKDQYYSFYSSSGGDITVVKFRYAVMK